MQWCVFYYYILNLVCTYVCTYLHIKLAKLRDPLPHLRKLFNIYFIDNYLRHAIRYVSITFGLGYLCLRFTNANVTHVAQIRLKSMMLILYHL